MFRYARIIALSIGIVVLLGIGGLFGRPLVLRYLAARSLKSANAAIVGYLSGKVSLDTAASHFNVAMTKWGEYQSAAFVASPLFSNGPSSARIEARPWDLPGYDSNDPRIEELTDRALLLQVGASRYAEIKRAMQEQQRRHADSDQRPER